MANNVSTRNVSSNKTNSDDAIQLIEFDFKIGRFYDKRIRKQIYSTELQAKLLKELLTVLIAKNCLLNYTDTVNLIKNNRYYSIEAEFLIKNIRTLFFDPTLRYEYKCYAEELIDTIENRFKTTKYDTTFALCSTTDIEKSSIIQTIISHYADYDIHFPHNEYPYENHFIVDYDFVAPRDTYKLFIFFDSPNRQKLLFCECITRAVSSYINMVLSGEPDSDLIKDTVMSSFIFSSDNSFDLRYTIGPYYMSTSPERNKPEYQKIVNEWDKYYSLISDMADGVFNASLNQVFPGRQTTAGITHPYSYNQDVAFYELIFSNLIKETDSISDGSDYYYHDYKKETDNNYNTVQAKYNELLTSLLQKVEKIREECSISDVKPGIVTVYNAPSYINIIIPHNSFSDYIKLISMFYSKSPSRFGHSFYNLINYIKLEIPLNKNFISDKNNPAFVIRDMMGLSFYDTTQCSIINSTHLRFDDIDSVIIVNDSRNCNEKVTSTLIKQLSSIMSLERVFFAFTYFDEMFKKEVLNGNDSKTIYHQKIIHLSSWLSDITNKSIPNSSEALMLNKKIRSHNNCFYLNSLAPNTMFTETIDNNICSGNVINMLECLFEQKSKNDDILNHISKIDTSLPLLKYDYKKIPLLYMNVINKYTTQQYDIYINNPPQNKSVEALTLRLANGLSSYNTDTVLRPLGDLYDIFINVFSDYIVSPKESNLSALDIDPVLDIVKKQFASKLRQEINERFSCNMMRYKWEQLYKLTGLESDIKRRKGILSLQAEILPDVNLYMHNSIENHFIDIIEQILNDSIQYAENKVSNSIT